MAEGGDESEGNWQRKTESDMQGWHLLFLIAICAWSGKQLPIPNSLSSVIYWAGEANDFRRPITQDNTSVVRKCIFRIAFLALSTALVLHQECKINNVFIIGNSSIQRKMSSKIICLIHILNENKPT